MIHTIFEWREDREHGNEGWIQKGFPYFNASNGLMVAHDTLEHFANGDGSLTDEMLAFGAIMYIRGESGWFGQQGSRVSCPAENCATDIAYFLRDERSGNLYLKRAPRTCKLNDDVAEHHIQEAVHGGLREAIREFPDECRTMRQTDQVIRSMISWMRIGYRKAVKRFYDNRAWEVADCFDRIVKDVDSKFKYGEFGQELHVRVNPSTLTVRIGIKGTESFNY